MNCPHCQTENREGAEFCKQCGKSIQSELICPSCGHPNTLDSRYCDKCGQPLTEPDTILTPVIESTVSATEPTSFADGRYQVIRKLGEGGKKKVYLVHDKKLDRDAAFALIKTENLDEDGRKRVTREAQAMGKLGDNPHIVSIFDTGQINGQPYIIIPVMGGGDVEALIEKAPDHKLPLDQIISIGKAVCQGLDFAHSKGVIHRDLKPGNVWLSDDGSAKIGDFGLAVMTDISRLTMEGMMIGTVSYMPPEQAMGREVTPRADLYSLGAMLYEMVTGRPPFVGDDSVSIIGQHINTVPIRPTWYRTDLPLALDSLIMRLLEKDPGKRPSSAEEISQVLESMKRRDKEALVKDQHLTFENPIYRRIFVGRENELKQLQNAFINAMSGQGTLVMVAGEPGIGKTAICRQLATYVALKGGKALFGHCYEEGSLALPYLAFIEAIRTYVLNGETEVLKKEMGSGVVDIARIVSEIKEKLKVKPRSTGNLEEDKYRLMQSVANFLRNASCIDPVLVVLDDMHNADKGTLEMLSYISRNLIGTKLLLVGTYRDVDVDRSHPLAATLAELRSISTFNKITLRGLSVEEVRRMLVRVFHYEIPKVLAEIVHYQTEGNPLFVQEVVRYLTDKKLLVKSGDKMLIPDISQIEVHIPEGLKDVIGKRLSLLSSQCNEFLKTAAVVGVEFRLDVISKITSFSEEELSSLLYEASKAAIIEECPTVDGALIYRFTHSFYRQTLYEEIIAPYRIRLHISIGQVLEKIYSQRLEECASVLIEHFSHSSEHDILKKSVIYGELGATYAKNHYAYDDAIRLLDKVINIQKVLDSHDNQKLSDLYLQLSDYLLLNTDTKRVINETAIAAFEAAKALGDDKKAVDACMKALNAISREKAGPGYVTPEWAEWSHKADDYAKPGTIERAHADWALGCMKCALRDTVPGQTLLHESLNLARKFNDTNSIIKAGSALLLYQTAPQHTSNRTKLANELLNLSDIDTNFEMGVPHFWIGDTFLSIGNRHSVENIVEQLRHLANHNKNVLLDQIIAAMDSVILFIDGNLEKSIRTSADILFSGEESGTFGNSGIYASLALIKSSLYLGYSPQTLVNRFPEMLRIIILPLVLAHIGKDEEVNLMLDEILRIRSNHPLEYDETHTWADVLILEAGVIVNHRDLAEFMLNRFKDNELYTSGFFYPTSITRHLGAAATLVEKYDDAYDYYNKAIKQSVELGFRSELALSRFQFAALLLKRYPNEKKLALKYLDLAIEEFINMKMRLSLKQALAYRKQTLPKEKIVDLLPETLLTIERLGFPLIDEDTIPSSFYYSSFFNIPRINGLTEREIDVIKLLTKGMTNREVAEKLFISEHTVASHLRKILAKTNLPNRAAVAAYALQNDLIEH